MTDGENGTSIKPWLENTGTHKAKVFSFITQASADLTWEGIGFSVKEGKGRKHILREVSGNLQPGQLTCILGPSGSGKTSLLNFLAGRVRPGGKFGAELAGKIQLNGTVIDPFKHQSLFGYVMQDDALLGTMTPREVFEFSAKLRLNGDATKGNMRAELLDDMIESLGLKACQNTFVGDELIKGISGGERKRTAVGAELITNPQITFLDEPTSGLDTAAAYNLVCMLKELTNMQQSVLCTIHQPSSEIFHLFDQSIFLVGGEVVYHGPPSGIRAHFRALNHTCPDDYNPADFVMFITQTGDDARKNSLVKSWKEKPDGWVKKVPPTSSESDLPAAQKSKGCFIEFPLLAQREIRRTLRDKATLGARFGSTIFLTLVYSLVFFRIGSFDQDESVFVKRDRYNPQPHAGAVTMLGISAMFGAAQPLLLTFSQERPVFLREYASKMYGIVPYFISKSMVEIPLLILQNIVMFLVAYWLMALQGNFFYLAGTTTLVGLASSSLSLFAGSLVKDAKQAMEVAPALFVPQILFAGFFIQMEAIPPFMRWLQYICSLKWGMNMILLTEVGDLPPEQGNSEMLLEQNDINKDDAIIYALILLCITVVFRLCAMVALWRKSKAIYN